ncbi:cytochrome P450 [Streptomyces sp. NBC_00838]|uniref:cytochrome P450 family protein n=1 Tax=Streptomyces sp. NBC_00838 TaxID=2903680 RepID=UPI003868F80B|nr:cytochrome P450 [Streptomyces sp. NBC_00838]
MTTQARCPYPLDASGSDIHGEGAALAERGPATRVTLPGLSEEIPAWSVTDPALVRKLLISPYVSKDAHQHWPAYRNGQIPESWPLRVWTDVRNALTAYGREHTRLRKPLKAAFSSRRVRAMEPTIRTITDELLDELAPGPAGGPVDFRARFAWRLPLLVVNTVLGVPSWMHDQFRDAIGLLFNTSLTGEEAAAALKEVRRLLGLLIAHRRTTAGDDVTSALIATQEASAISEDELIDSLLLLIGAGHETTVNLLDHAVVNLLTHPAQLDLARTGQIGWPKVVEETLRHQAPVASILLRFATTTFLDEQSGVTFEEGDAIVINYAAANRNPRVHGANAAAFDITRTSHEHLAFGHGTHFCLGAELARLEATIALEALTTRYPAMRLAVDPVELKPLPSFISNGHQEVPITLAA